MIGRQRAGAGVPLMISMANNLGEMQCVLSLSMPAL